MWRPGKFVHSFILNGVTNKNPCRQKRISQSVLIGGKRSFWQLAPTKIAMPVLDYTNRKTLAELQTLPKPTNKHLTTLLTDIDKVIIKKGGVYKDKAMGEEIWLPRL